MLVEVTSCAVVGLEGALVQDDICLLDERLPLGRCGPIAHQDGVC
jgi:hypothetical protein